MTDRVRQKLGNYQLVRLLGEGGFAEVYLGEHVHLGTQAAIKVLHTQLTTDDVDKFRAEARTIARLVHPHIVRVLDFGVEEGTPYLIMDYASNGSLRQRHPKGTHLPLTTIVGYVKQVAEALQYAHDEKVIHRDIKPENMLLGWRNEILLSDFGIALVAQSTHYQSIQEVIGTAAYMAPEQLQGKPRRASDQYALGIVVYEWFCGERPFHGSFTELYSQHLFVPPPSLCEKVPELPLTVEEIVLTALAKDPNQRFPSVQAFALALEQAYQSVEFHPPTSFVVVAPPLDQSPLPNVIAASPSQHSSPTDTVAAMPPDQVTQAADGVTSPSQLLEPTNTAIPASQSTQLTDTVTPSTAPVVSPPTAKGPAQSGGPRLFPLPSQRRISRRIVVVGLTGLVVAGGGLTWIALSQKQPLSSSSARPTVTSSPAPTPSPAHSPTPTPLLPGSTLYTYPGFSNLVTAVAWSPDGKRLAASSLDRTVQVWDAATGEHLLTYTGHSADVRSVAWSPNGKHLASASADHTVQIWNATDGLPVYTYHGHSDYVTSVTWSPDNSLLASVSDDHTAQVWNATTGDNIYTYRFYVPPTAIAWSPDGKRIASAGGAMQVWDASGGSILTYHTTSNYNMNSVAWSPNNSRLASGISDKTVQIWNAATGGIVLTYRGHSDVVEGVAWSPDGKRIASSSWDQTVQVWDATTGSTFLIYHGHSSRVVTVAWSPDGKRIASAGKDEAVQVWKAL